MIDKKERSEVLNDMSPETLTQKPIVILLDIDYTVFNTGRFRDSKLKDYSLYPGDLEALETLAELADLGILSQEIPPIDQRRKLDETGIRKYFPDKRIHLYANKLAEMRWVFDQYRNRRRIILVDDKPRVLMEAKRENPDVVTVFVNRGPYAQEAPGIEGFNPDRRIDDLAGLVPFVQSICAEFSERTNKVRSSLA